MSYEFGISLVFLGDFKKLEIEFRNGGCLAEKRVWPVTQRMSPESKSIIIYLTQNEDPCTKI